MKYNCSIIKIMELNAQRFIFSMAQRSKQFLGVIFITLFGLSQSMEIPLLPLVKTLKNVEPINEFKASDASIQSLALSNDGNFMVVGSSNSSGGKQFWGVSLWNKSEWKVQQPLEDIFANNKLDLPIDRDYSTQSLAISVDNNIIMGQSDDHIWKWDIKNKRLIGFENFDFLQVNTKPRIERTKFLPNKNKIIVNQDLRTGIRFFYKYISAKIFDLNSGKLLRTLEGASDYVFDLAVNPQETLIGAVLNDRSVMIWDADTAKIVIELKAEPRLITRIDISKNYIATYGLNDEVKLQHLNLQEVKSWKFSANRTAKNPSDIQISQLKIAPNEKYIIFRTNVAGWLEIIDIESEKIVRFKLSELDDSGELPTKFIISNDSKHLIAGNAKGIIKIFDIEAILEKKPIKKPELDLNMLRNSLMQLTAIVSSLASK